MPMTLRIEQLTVDSRDTMAQARFWAAVLDVDVDQESDQEESYIAPADSPPGSFVPGILFLRVPETKSIKNRLHLCLRPENQETEVARLESLGARRADIGQDDSVTWVVMADPEGNEFCVLSASKHAEAAEATGPTAPEQD